MAGSVSYSKIFDAVKEARADRDLPRVCVVGAEPHLRRVEDVLGEGTRRLPGGASAAFDALELGELQPQLRTFDPYDIVVFVAGGVEARRAAPYVKAARGGGRAVVALIEDADADAWAHVAGVARDEIARGVGRNSKARPSLERRLVQAAERGAATLAAHLPAMRRAYAEHVIFNNAKQNGVIGVLVIIPGADMPAMTANQIRMVLQIAKGYGEEVSFDRALEILTIVGSAFAFRALARQALAFVPGFGWVLKGAVGFAGTMALGRAAITYFEAGAPLQVSHMKRVEHQVERLRSKLPDGVQRHLAGR